MATRRARYVVLLAGATALCAAVAGATAAAGRRAEKLLALRADAEKGELVVEVWASGCTQKADFRIERAGEVLTVVRLRPDACKTTPERATVTFTYASDATCSCNTSIIAYGSSGNNANNDIILDGLVGTVQISATSTVTQEFPVFGPIDATLTGEFDANFHFVFGFDTDSGGVHFDGENPPAAGPTVDHKPHGSVVEV